MWIAQEEEEEEEYFKNVFDFKLNHFQKLYFVNYTKNIIFLNFIIKSVCIIYIYIYNIKLKLLDLNLNYIVIKANSKYV